MNVAAATLALCLSLGFLVYALNFSEFSWAYKQSDPCARGQGPYLEDGLASSLAWGGLGAIAVLLTSMRGRPWAAVGRMDRIALAVASMGAIPALASGVLLVTIPPCIII